MANRIQRKQFDWINGVPVEIVGFASTASDSAVVTTAISTALSTAGRLGGAVPTQITSDTETQGIVTTGATARSEIKLTATGKKIDGDGQGNEVYGRLTEAAGVYTLSYFYNDATGTEQTYTFGTSENINFTICYRYRSDDIPVDALYSILSRDIQQDPGSGAGITPVDEVVTITATNTFAALSQTPNPLTAFKLKVNGVVFDSLTGSPVSVTGTAITWTPAAFGAQDAYNVETTDRATAHYFV